MNMRKDSNRKPGFMVYRLYGGEGVTTTKSGGTASGTQVHKCVAE